MNGIFRIITCYAKIQLFSQKNINIAGCRFFLAIICYYFSTFVVRIWQIQISKVGIRMKIINYILKTNFYHITGTVVSVYKVTII